MSPEELAPRSRGIPHHDLPRRDVLRDGGLGRRDRAVTDLDVVGIAKSRLKVDQDSGKRHRSDERLFRPGRKNAVTFLPNSPALHILQRVRDEAHRFAITYHKNLRSKQTLRSELEDIPGVGAGRRTQLLRHFGSLKQIREASLPELQSVPGLPDRTAQAVYDYFHAPTAPVA